MARRRARIAALHSTSIVALLASCVAIDPDAQLCAVGAAGCACTIGGACDAGLECREQECVDPNAPATTGVESSSGSASSEVSMTSVAETSDASSSGAIPGDDANLVFVTSTLHTGGSLGGTAGADAICQARAEAAGLAGTYRAWLSAPGENARDRLGDARGWVRTDGRPLARDLDQLLSGTFYYPPITDEHGTAIPVPDFAWTGTLDDGLANDVDGTGFCGGWTVDQPDGFAWIGDLGAGPAWWTVYGSQPCTGMARLMCFGIDHDHELAYTPTDGRAAFVSNAFLAPSAGRDMADAICQTEAEAAGHTGTFLALLGTNAESPAGRFATDGAPWVRADGVPIYRDGDPLGVTMETPMVFDAQGAAVFAAIAWAGAYGVDEVGTDAETCTDWTSTTGFAAMFSTIHVFWQAWTIDGHSMIEECAQGGYPVLCFEQ